MSKVFQHFSVSAFDFIILCGIREICGYNLPLGATWQPTRVGSNISSAGIIPGFASAATRARQPYAARHFARIFCGETGILVSNRVVLNFFKKGLASASTFDIFTAPLRPKGRKDSMFADR